MRKNCYACLNIREFGDVELLGCKTSEEDNDVFMNTEIVREGDRFYLRQRIEDITFLKVFCESKRRIDFCPFCGRKLTKRIRKRFLNVKA